MISPSPKIAMRFLSSWHGILVAIHVNVAVRSMPNYPYATSLLFDHLPFSLIVIKS